MYIARLRTLISLRAVAAINILAPTALRNCALVLCCELILLSFWSSLFSAERQVAVTGLRFRC